MSKVALPGQGDKLGSLKEFFLKIFVGILESDEFRFWQCSFLDTTRNGAVGKLKLGFDTWSEEGTSHVTLRSKVTMICILQILVPGQVIRGNAC